MPQRIDEWIGGPVLVLLVFLLVFGLLWAPIGGFICNRVARKRGLDADRYTMAGLGYSALFFLPWIYLVTRILDRRIPSVIIYLVYAFFYLSWFAMIAGTIYFGLTEGELGSVRMRRGFGIFFLIILAWGAVIVMQAFTWFYSLQFLLQSHRWHRRNLGGAPRNILPRRYLHISICSVFYVAHGVSVPMGIYNLLNLTLEATHSSAVFPA